MIEAKDYLKRNKKAREIVAKQLNIVKKDVQELIYNLLEHASEVNYIVTAQSCHDWAVAHPKSQIYKILDWESDESARLALITTLLEYLSFLIGPDNKVYNIKKISE